MAKHNILIFLLSFGNLFLSCTSNSQSSSTNQQVNVKNTTSNTVVDTVWTSKIDKPNSYWKTKLSKDQFYILRQKGTERPFTHPYNKNKKQGTYLCAACDNPLFSSDTKFKSGTGWPSFFKPYFSKSVHVAKDNSHGMTRDEVVCGKCDGHLGHVFNDGPEPTGLRYCMNGGALNFEEQKVLKKVVFAQGCFWCVEEIFESIKGVEDVVSGYSGGSEANPTYKQVGSGQTSHAEAIEISYDVSEISFEELLKVYFNSGDITQVNGQGNDIGTQYRSIVFYDSEDEKLQIEAYIQKLEVSGNYSKPIAVEVLPKKTFYLAEQYHQNYVQLNPKQGYVKAVSIPRYEKAIKKFPELLK